MPRKVNIWTLLWNFLWFDKDIHIESGLTHNGQCITFIEMIWRPMKKTHQLHIKSSDDNNNISKQNVSTYYESVGINNTLKSLLQD